VSRYFQVLPLDTAVELLRRAELPPGAIAVTFDDGYRDNYEVALPILQRHGICATFFIASGYLDGGIMFNDVIIESLRRTALQRLDLTSLGLGSYTLANVAERRATVREILPRLKYAEWGDRAEKAKRVAELAQVEPPSGLMMTSDQVRALHSAGMGIGAHTVHHPILAMTRDSDAINEIQVGRRTLDEITGVPVTLFAYPNGGPGRDYRAEHVSMVKSLGFLGAVSTAPGVATGTTDLFQLPRFTPWERKPWRFVARLIKNYFDKDVTQV
jgi:peptidoglycan/xylan/chitin deacetylase (PgdA/CDA1 family)